MIPPVLALAILFFPAAQSPPDDVEALLERLKADDAGERRRTGEELLKRGDAARAAMVRSLESGAPAPAEKVAALLKQLSSRSWKERNEATQALVRLGRPVRALLEGTASTADPEVAWRIRAALSEIQDKAGRDEQLEEFRAITLCDLLATAREPRAAPALLRILSSGAPEQRTELRLRAAEALGRLRPVLDAAQAEDSAERIMALLEKTAAPLAKGVLLKALGRLGSPAAVRPLTALLADRSEKNLHLKRSCMAALAAIGHPRGIRALVDALASEDVYMAQGAAALLSELTGDDFGYDPRASAEANREAVAKFRAWAAAKFGKAWEE